MRRLRPPRELRVDDLVAPVRQALEEVGEPAPGAVDERGLIDERRTLADGLRRGGRRHLPAGVPGAPDFDDAGAERGEIRRLVLLAFPPDELGVRVVPVGPLELLARDSNGKRR